jgi:hypothetical protein
MADGEGDRPGEDTGSVKLPDDWMRIPTKPGHAFQQEAGHRFRFEAGRGSDLKSATGRLLPRIEVMMFCLAGLVKRSWIWASAK